MRIPLPSVTFLAPALCLVWLSDLPHAQDFVPVTDVMLVDPDPADWLMVHRTYDFQSFSPLDQINRSNVGELQLAWMRAMDEGPVSYTHLTLPTILLV